MNSILTIVITTIAILVTEVRTGADDILKEIIVEVLTTISNRYIIYVPQIYYIILS